MNTKITEYEIIDNVNRDVNSRIAQEPDRRGDYWQCPSETWERMAGDCEDMAIAKYYALRNTFGDDRLHLAYARTRKDSGHLVLLVRIQMKRRSAWWKVWERPTWRDSVAVLDNLHVEIYDLDTETHFVVEYLINESEFIIRGKKCLPSQHPKWREMILRRGAGLRSGENLDGDIVGRE